MLIRHVCDKIDLIHSHPTSGDVTFCDLSLTSAAVAEFWHMAASG